METSQPMRAKAAVSLAECSTLTMYAAITSDRFARLRGEAVVNPRLKQRMCSIDARGPEIARPADASGLCMINEISGRMPATSRSLAFCGRYKLPGSETPSNNNITKALPCPVTNG